MEAQYDLLYPLHALRFSSLIHAKKCVSLSCIRLLQRDLLYSTLDSSTLPRLVLHPCNSKSIVLLVLSNALVEKTRNGLCCRSEPILPGRKRFATLIPHIELNMQVSWKFISKDADTIKLIKMKASNISNPLQTTSNAPAADGTESHALPPSLPARTRFRVTRTPNRNVLFIDSKSKNSSGPDMMDGTDFSEQLSFQMTHTYIPEGPVVIKVDWYEDAINKDPTARQEDLVEGFQELASILSVLGTSEGFGFERWEALLITLPEVEIPFDQVIFPRFHVELTSLRSFNWKGPKQILDSWFPLAPALLGQLKNVTIRCPTISPRDFQFIERNATNAEHFDVVSRLCLPPP
ncbi:hypothetical protein H0H92_010127 [Tricholoma furcatifolium]|nr:hypothetical protein H0H92_010127 [Tricholoma furcatifolium]